jgi:propanol-preferring alcohol dehydrogenase
MTGTMRAGQWDPRTQSVDINEVRIPEPGPTELLVKITSASLCHSDIMSIERPDLQTPFTLGHEAVGTIDKMPPSIKDSKFKVGDAIGFLCYLGACFECDACMIHNTLCKNGELEIQGFTQPGFFAEYAVVVWRSAIHLPNQWNLQTSSVFFCAGLTGE